MHECLGFVCYLLSAVGLTVIVVWPEKGIAAWVRDRILRSLIPAAVVGVLDCFVCFSFWAGLLLSPLFWWRYHEMWCWCGPLIGPAIFWSVLRERS